MRSHTKRLRLMRSGTNSQPPTFARFGLTLIEVMIATTITLLMMLALAQGFKSLSQTVSEGRAKLILSDQLRGLNQLLRSDLEGRTTDSSTPQSALLSAGYFKYYDGPISDATAALFNHLPTTNPDVYVEGRLSASKWGDIDDILMFTAKAKPGQVFRGKVPWALLMINAVNKGGALPSGFNWTTAWQTDVTISSEYAEIVWFVMPLNELNSIDPNNPDNMVFDVAPGVVDHNGDGVLDTDGMPDRVALCRRVLLIRPDMNITPTEAMIGTAVQNGGSGGDYLTMQPSQPSLSAVNTFRFMMQYPYQRCDLSVRPAPVSLVSGSTFVSVATNSIESLQLPENRFAHYGFPVSSGGVSGTTIPALVLSTEFPSTIVPPSTSDAYLLMTNPVFANIGMNAALASFRDRGFLPSCFMRTKPVANATGGYSNVPLLEEIVASNVIAFDVKGFDTSVKQLAHPGSDGNWGVTNVPAEAGWPGTDDLSLAPSDPGYAIQLVNIAKGGAAFEIQSGNGTFVDVGWGSKVYNSIHPDSAGGVSMTGLTAAQLSNIVKFFPSSLSLLDLNATSNGLIPATSLYDSGAYVDTTVHQLYQPAFDTFTTAYEFDGEALGRSANGLIWQQGRRRFGFSVTQGALDVGNDGIGDDASDKEATPQIPYRLPSIQATIRVQDATAGTLQQISVVHDLTN